jgi:hypothetical protein
VNSKTAVIAAVLIGALGWALMGRDDAPPTAERRLESIKPDQTHSLPVRPTQPQQAQGSGSRYAQPQRADPDPWSTQATDQFRFRPLSERERERGLYNAYPGPGHHALEGTATPSWSSGDPRAQDGYRFRPIEPNAGGGTRWQTPYPMTPGGGEPGTSGQWADQLDPPPWRSPGGPRHPATYPPAQRMLPSLDWPGSRTLSAR